MPLELIPKSYVQNYNIVEKGDEKDNVLKPRVWKEAWKKKREEKKNNNNKRIIIKLKLKKFWKIVQFLVGRATYHSVFDLQIGDFTNEFRRVRWLEYAT